MIAQCDEKIVTIAAQGFVRGSLKRGKYTNYNKKYLYKYREIKADMLNNNTFCNDYYMEELYRYKCITKETLRDYYIELIDYLTHSISIIDKTEEEMYGDILLLRQQFYNPKVTQYNNNIKAELIQNSKLLNKSGIDQRELFYDKLKSNSIVYCFIDEIKYLETFKSFYSSLKEMGKSIKVYVKSRTNHPLDISIEDFHSIIDYEDIIQLEDSKFGYDLSNIKITDNSILLCFGEWFLGTVKKLNVDAFVCCSSNEIITRDATNSNDKSENHFIYIPKKYNLIDELQTVELSFINYRILYWIYLEVGIRVYEYSFEELLEYFSHYFINYKSDKMIEFIPFNYTGNFYIDRIKSIFDYANSRFKDVSWLEKTIIDKKNQDMRVCSVSISKKMLSKISVNCFNEAANIRSLYRKEPISLGIVSNFLFFTTEKSIASFNKLREDRTKEMYHSWGWHLDYKFENNMGTVPLYNKACVTLYKNGEIEFGLKTLDQGWFEIDNNLYKCDKTNINIKPLEDECDLSNREFVVYTPMYSKSNTEDFQSKIDYVGANRVNLVLINNDVVCIRKGDVILPSIGVVLSFSKEEFVKTFGNRKFDENGYYIDDQLSCSFKTKHDQDIEWSYGGGMLLIDRGQAFDNEEVLMTEFAKEGWLRDLSKQTQGSLTYRNEKHPRTVIGKTYSGEFFIIVCTGRSKFSVGADYIDLIRIAKELYSDVEYLMNIDGGASSVLGLVIDGEVVPLTDITYTEDSAAGEIRELNSILRIDVKS